MSNTDAIATHVRAPLARAGRGPGMMQRALDRAERQCHVIERQGLWLFAAVSAFYWLLTAVLAERKLLWNDELFTYYISILPSVRDVWGALLTGADQTPPLLYLATRSSFALFGINNLSVRLPEMVGFWMMSACLLVFVKRRTTWLPALCAAVTPLVTAAYSFAFEARAYGLVLGFSALALLCWQSAALQRQRLLSLIGLALSLSGAVSSHYYGVLVLMALAIGEITRTLALRRLDVSVWATFVPPVLALALHLPLIRAGQGYAGAFWATPQWVSIPDFYAYLLAPALVAVMVILLAAIVCLALAGPSHTPLPTVQLAVAPAEEVAAACGFIVIPVACVVIAKFVTGAFIGRYALPAVIGFAVLAGFGTAMAFRRFPVMRVLTAACLIGWFGLSQARELVQPTGSSLPVTPLMVNRPVEWLQAIPSGNLSLVVADPLTFMVLSHYGSPDLKTRLVYLADPALSLKHLGHNSAERGVLELEKPWFHMNVVEFEPFFTTTPEFLVYGDDRGANHSWIVPELQRRGLRLELLRREGDNMLLRAGRSIS